MDTSGKNLLKFRRIAKCNAELNLKIQQILDDGDSELAGDFFSMDAATQRRALTCLLTTHNVKKDLVAKFLHETNYDKEWLVEKQDRVKDQIYLPHDSLHHYPLVGVTALHLAVYQNSLHADEIAKLLLMWESKDFHAWADDEKNLSMSSIPMNCGSYPLHILSAHNLTIQEDVLMTLLDADPSIAFKDDSNGDNPISLLWKNVLRFRWALSVMEGSDYDIDYIEGDDCSWMTVITPRQYIRYSLLMAVMARRKERVGYMQINDLGSITIHDICRIPRCPPMLMNLLSSPKYNTLFEVEGNAFSSDRNGMLPIHHAVQTPPVTFQFLPCSLKSERQTSLVEILLAKNPNGPKVHDEFGRLPLHYALDRGCLSEKDLLSLIRHYPESLRMQDPETGLLPFMLLASKSDSGPVRNDTRGLFHFADFNTEKNLSSRKRTGNKEYIHTRYEAEWKKDPIRMSCHLLNLYPDVISTTNSNGFECQGQPMRQ